MVSALISRVVVLVFGTLLPAYRSYKAIQAKNAKEYVRWMMYWIVYALFITSEAFSDMFLSWLPLYYEVKVVFVIWLVSPATKGASMLYRRYVHPKLTEHEAAIDRYLKDAQANGYATFADAGMKCLNIASETVIKTVVSSQCLKALTSPEHFQQMRATEHKEMDHNARVNQPPHIHATNQNARFDHQPHHQDSPRHHAMREEFAR